MRNTFENGSDSVEGSLQEINDQLAIYKSSPFGLRAWLPWRSTGNKQIVFAPDANICKACNASGTGDIVSLLSSVEATGYR